MVFIPPYASLRVKKEGLRHVTGDEAISPDLARQQRVVFVQSPLVVSKHIIIMHCQQCTHAMVGTSFPYCYEVQFIP